MPKTLDLPKPLYEFAVHALSPQLVDHWEDDRFISQLPARYKNYVEWGHLRSCLGASGARQTQCQSFSKLLATITQDLEKKLIDLDLTKSESFNEIRLLNIKHTITQFKKLQSKIGKVHNGKNTPKP